MVPHEIPTSVVAGNAFFLSVASSSRLLRRIFLFLVAISSHQIGRMPAYRVRRFLAFVRFESNSRRPPHAGAGHSESGMSSSPGSPRDFFNTGLRRPTCINDSKKFLAAIRDAAISDIVPVPAGHRVVRTELG